MRSDIRLSGKREKSSSKKDPPGGPVLSPPSGIPLTINGLSPKPVQRRILVYENPQLAVPDMNEYQQEQLDALKIVRHGLRQLGEARRVKLIEAVSDYMQFRESVDGFLNRYFHEECTRTCYQSRTSACCARDSIITFFADTVIDALHAPPAHLDRLETMLCRVNAGQRCVYLGSEGCAWTVRPVVCAMFLCDRAMDAVFRRAPEAREQWASLRRQEKKFKWPDRPVLFDHLEKGISGYGLPVHAHAPEPESRGCCVSRKMPG